MTRRAAEFLEQMPHVGPHAELVSAVEALGLTGKQDDDRTLVLFGDSIISVVAGDELSLNTQVIRSIAKSMPPVTPEQGRAFDRILSRLERDSIAVHEAGHVVAAHSLGFKICFARLGEVSEVQLCRDNDMDSLDYNDVGTVEDFQEYVAAGAAAELLVFGRYR